MRLKATAIGIVLASTAMGTCALTLGRAKGAVWIGQPLEITVPVQSSADAGQSLAALCAQAQVFQAESQVESNRVQVLTEMTDRTDTVNVRVISSAIVDEPVVSVELRIGCDQPVRRRYVLLPDFPSESLPRAPASASATLPLASAVAAEATQLQTPPTATPSGLALAPQASPQAAPTKVIEKRPDQPRMQAPAPKAKPKTNTQQTPTPAAKITTPARPSAAAASAPRSRLKLDPMEALVRRGQTVEPIPVAAPQEEVQQAQRRVEQLQGEMKALNDLTAQNQTTMRALQERLRKAEEDRVSEPVIYLLLALLLLSVAAVVVLLKRRADLIQEIEQKQQKMLAAASAVVSRHPQVAAVAIAPATDVDFEVDMQGLDEKYGPEVNMPKVSRHMDPAAPPALPSLPSVDAANETHPANFHAPEQYDLIDRVHLSVKLGQFAKASEELKQRIKQDPSNCPLIFLAALQIASENSLTDFRHFREEFQMVFNARVPDFAVFNHQGRGLEGYPSLAKHICELWPSAKVLDVMEECVLKSPWGNTSDPLDMSAFKDLITLHGIAALLAEQRSASTASVKSADDINSTEHLDLGF